MSLQSRVGICWELISRSCLIVTPRLNVQKWQLAGPSAALGASTHTMLAPQSRELSE